MGNQIDSVNRIPAHHTDDAGLQFQRQRLTLLDYLLQPRAAQGFLLDDLSGRCASRRSEGPAAVLARGCEGFQDSVARAVNIVDVGNT